MKFHLTQEQVAIQDAIHRALAEIFPIGALHVLADSEDDFDAKSWFALMGLGLGGLLVSEDAGGVGLGLVEAALAVEVVGGAAAPGPVIGQMLTALAVSHSQNADAKPHLTGLISGASVATLALGGDGAPESWSATPQGGEVRFVQSARAANLFLVGTKGGGLSLVEAGLGVSLTPVRSTDRSRRLSTVAFAGAASQELLAAGDPFVQKIVDAALVLLAADALGGAQHCVDVSVSYALQREQFGQPIAQFQALKHQLAHMALEVEPARALVWYAAYAHDADLPDASRAAAIAKAHLTERFVSVTRAAVAAHGGIGYTWEYGLNYWFRRAVFDRAYLGTPGQHRARAAALAGW
jgi:alkylation response protein AidB-like acyl-CoA dehydrogenase